jgi:hypothetical protein
VHVRSLAVVAAVAACSYTPGSYHSTWLNLIEPGYAFPVHRATLGCIDLAVGRVDQSYATGPVIEYGFGNRCDRRVPVDLVSLRVIARGADGSERALVAYDPRRELRVLPLVARMAGVERIEYRDPIDPRAPLDGPICVDVGGVDASMPRAERWLCTRSVR